MRPREIITSVMHQMTEDTKYIKIATATSFIHALIFNIIILFYLFSYSDLFSRNNPLGKLLHSYIDLVQFDTSMIGWGILVGIILLIGYLFLPPIGEASMIFYLDDKTEKKDEFRALAKGLYKFFPMFEFGATTSLFKVPSIMLVVIRLVLFDLRSNPLIIILMSIWITISFFVTLLLPYTKMLICLEGYEFFDAMKKSTTISIQNLGITIKFVLINALLAVRFLINLAIIIGIPIGLVMLGTRFGLEDIWGLNILFLLILIGLVLIATYVEGIIEGFFTAVRMHIYKNLPVDKDE